SPNPKAGHNVWRFDNRLLRTAGIRVGGRIDDTMWMWRHFEPDLPAGLQFVSSFFGFPFPWKHYAASHPRFYGIADVDSVQHIMASLPSELRSIDSWRGYDRYLYQLYPIIEMASKRGLPIDPDHREQCLKRLDDRKGKISSELQMLIPERVKGFLPANGYKK